MADFQDTLQSILGNQEAMGQIMALARSLSGEESGAGEGPPPPPVPEREEPRPVPLGLETAGLPDLTALLGQVDPGLIQLGMRLFREYQGEDDRSAALLAALRPFLREERRAGLDRALQLARVTRLIRVALGAIGERGGEGRV